MGVASGCGRRVAENRSVEGRSELNDDGGCGRALFGDVHRVVVVLNATAPCTRREQRRWTFPLTHLALNLRSGLEFDKNTCDAGQSAQGRSTMAGCHQRRAARLPGAGTGGVGEAEGTPGPTPWPRLIRDALRLFGGAGAARPGPFHQSASAADPNQIPLPGQPPNPHRRAADRRKKILRRL